MCMCCGAVSAKGVIAQVEENRFFLCAACLATILPELLQGWPLIHSRTLHLCACCGLDSGEGIAVHVRTNWFFLCTRCTREVFPSLLITWRGFGLYNRAHRLWWRKFDRTVDDVQMETLIRTKEFDTLGSGPITPMIEIIIGHGDQPPMIVAGRCEACHVPLYPDILTCPVCGQKYCQYCGRVIDQPDSDRCPHCGGVLCYHPLQATITVLDEDSPDSHFLEDF